MHACLSITSMIFFNYNIKTLFLYDVINYLILLHNDEIRNITRETVMLSSNSYSYNKPVAG